MRVAAGIATHRVPSARLPRCSTALCGTVPVDAVLAAFAEPAGEGRSRRGAPRSTACSPATRVEDILAALEREAVRRRRTGRGKTAATMRTKSPLSLKLALAQVRRGTDAGISQTCMRTEFRIVSRIIHGHDFYEGVRAVIVDKDNAPRWQPATLAEVSEAEVERHFAPLAGDELALP